MIRLPIRFAARSFGQYSEHISGRLHGLPALFDGSIGAYANSGFRCDISTEDELFGEYRPARQLRVARRCTYLGDSHIGSPVNRRLA